MSIGSRVALATQSLGNPRIIICKRYSDSTLVLATPLETISYNYCLYATLTTDNATCYLFQKFLNRFPLCWYNVIPLFYKPTLKINVNS